VVIGAGVSDALMRPMPGADLLLNMTPGVLYAEIRLDLACGFWKLHRIRGCVAARRKQVTEPAPPSRHRLSGAYLVAEPGEARAVHAGGLARYPVQQAARVPLDLELGGALRSVAIAKMPGLTLSPPASLRSQSGKRITPVLRAAEKQ
jgi:hypothetical protein